VQGPFRSGQDNQETIYDNPSIKIGGLRKSRQYCHYAQGKASRRSRLQRHLNTVLALAGDRPEWVNVFLQEFRGLFGDLVLNLAINADLDGNSIYESQKMYMLKQVGIFSYLLQRR
jgi:hypothetical protein